MSSVFLTSKSRFRQVSQVWQLYPTEIPTMAWKVVRMDLETFVTSVRRRWVRCSLNLQGLEFCPTRCVVFEREGCPSVILTDQGTEYRGM